MHCVGAFRYSDTLLIWLFAFQPNVNCASCGKSAIFRVFLLPSADTLIRKICLFCIFSCTALLTRDVLKPNYQLQLFVTRT